MHTQRSGGTGVAVRRRAAQRVSARRERKNEIKSVFYGNTSKNALTGQIRAIKRGKKIQVQLTHLQMAVFPSS